MEIQVEIPGIGSFEINASSYDIDFQKIDKEERKNSQAVDEMLKITGAQIQGQIHHTKMGNNLKLNNELKFLQKTLYFYALIDEKQITHIFKNNRIVKK
jgi:hypothetical protein